MRDDVGGRPRGGADADCDIHALEREIEQAIFEAQVDADPRVLRHQSGHVRHDALETERDRCRDLERAFVTGSSPRGLRFIDLAKHAKARLVVSMPLCRDLHPPGGTPQKCPSKEGEPRKHREHRQRRRP